MGSKKPFLHSLLFAGSKTSVHTIKIYRIVTLSDEKVISSNRRMFDMGDSGQTLDPLDA